MSLNDTTNDIPYGYCHCGCGELAPIAPQSDTKKGFIRGQPMRFVSGHGRRRNPETRFWGKVQKRSQDECWEWQGSRAPNGYGKFSVRHKNISAHRFSYQLHYGSIPDGLLVAHHCDNPGCVNPFHLFAATQVENLADMAAKGRRPTGEEAPNAKLTTKDVIAIRHLHATGIPQRQLSRQFKVSRPQIRRIIHHQTWQHIP